jgi:S-DNA-T family DNA segregation ATPase FtsK/SpoIIIE
MTKGFAWAKADLGGGAVMGETRRKLELQSDRIEMVLTTHKAPARVTGGVVTPRAVQFYLAPLLGTKINRVQSLTEELALALGVSSVRVSRQGSSMQLQIPRDDARPVKLLSLMAALGAAQLGPRSESSHKSTHAAGLTGISASLPRAPSWIPPATAVLGLCDDGAPLLLRLPSPDVAHVLIAGCTGSGKTALSQTIILSLAMTHRRSQLQFVLVDPKRHAFMPFAPLPHLLRPVVCDAAEAVAALCELATVMEARGAAIGNSDAIPRIVVVLDELADLMQVGGRSLVEPLTRLVQRGREAGIHIIACTQKPSSEVMGALMRANFPVRLVGKVVSSEDARVAAGCGGTGAEKLAGRGDFIAVASGQKLRFQAAYVSPAEMEQVVAQCGSVPRRWDVIRGRPSLLHQAASLVASAS